ncbi:MAG: Ig-like domain-containing protein, partial [Spirochaetales bacterium]|nr:Ig-like domain-containing protein [Spirochaetales bacterium]
MKRLWNLCLPLGVIFVLALAACQNPVDLVDEVTRVVMEANDRYVEVTEIFPEAGENDINASAVISVDFDRSIDPLSLEGNITVRYNGDEDGSNRISEDWEILYNETLRRLTIDASPWLDSNRTITVTLENLTGVDGSTMQEKKEWSFQTNNDAAFNLTIDEEYANISNHTAVPLTLEF